MSPLQFTRLVLLWIGATAACAAEPPPDLTLRSEITGADHQTYRLLPFDVPAGVKAIEISFEYTGREARTTIDAGLLGPGESFQEAFRGWSGGNKSSFVVSADDATPAYLLRPITPGRWSLLLGVPNIRSSERSDLTARIRFIREGGQATRADSAAIKSEAGWYRGDLHMHTGHSDGACLSRSGKQRVPCPVFLTLSAAAERGLDFVAVTEHNTTSHVRDLTALQPYFDNLLLIPGMEVTTFQGHANAFGVREPVDFRIGSPQTPDWNTVLSDLAARGATVSINHPRLPSGEACMGCGWTAQPAADMKRLQAVEIVNGYTVDGSTSGVDFWHAQLQQGHRLTGIGGSDTHDVTSTTTFPKPARVGTPTTVVHASALSVAAILEGIRAGAVFVDTAGTRDRSLEFSAHVNDRTVAMGAVTELRKGEVGRFVVRVRNVARGRIEIIRDGSALPTEADSSIPAEAHEMAFELPGDGARHWIRINVRDGDGRVVLIGNPIYINWEG